MVKVKRDGSFVRIELPAPGRWVIAMTPATTMSMAAIISAAKVGTHVIDGDVVVQIDTFEQSGRTAWLLLFPPWPGVVGVDRAGLDRLVLELRLACHQGGA